MFQKEKKKDTAKSENRMGKRKVVAAWGGDRKEKWLKKGEKWEKRMQRMGGEVKSGWREGSK